MMYTPHPSPSSAMRPLGGIDGVDGSFTLTCNDNKGRTGVTGPINIQASVAVIESAIGNACPGVRDYIIVTELKTYDYTVNGRHFRISFSDAYDYDDFVLSVSISGGSPPGYYATYNTPIPYSPNLFYENIPAEFLHTVHELP